MNLKYYLFFTLLYFFFLEANSQNNVLVVDYNNAFSSDQSTTWNKSEVYNRLVATNTSVTRINSIPATINTTYDECWIFGNMGTTTAANLNPVVNYINSGGAVYVQSEVSCCPNQAAFVDNIINSVTIAGPSITHNLIKSYKYEADIHPDLTCGPFPVRFGASARLFVGTPSNNILFEANTTCGTPLTSGDVIGVRFGACDMISGQGAFIANGDFNIFPQGTCTSTGILGTPNNPNIIDMIANLMDSLLVCKTTGCPVLPIELLSFEGFNENGINHLNWTTLSEINNDYFTVERSINAIDFEAIEIIKGAGNSNTQLFYEYRDLNSPKGISYYRIKQTDYDKKYSFSQMITINNDDLTNIKIYPNPAYNELTIESNNMISKLVIYDIVGKVISSQTIQSKFSKKINVSKLNPGTYFISIFDSYGNFSIEKFNKNQ